MFYKNIEKCKKMHENLRMSKKSSTFAAWYRTRMASAGDSCTRIARACHARTIPRCKSTTFFWHTQIFMHFFAFFYIFVKHRNLTQNLLNRRYWPHKHILLHLYTLPRASVRERSIIYEESLHTRICNFRRKNLHISKKYCTFAAWNNYAALAHR